MTAHDRTTAVDSGNAEEPPTSEEAGPSDDAQIPGNADTGQAVTAHTGESHDDPESSEAIQDAASPGGSASTATEAAAANEAAQEWAERREAEAERAIEARDDRAADPAPAAVAAHAAAGAPASTLIESTQIRRAITIAEKRTELKWSVFVGTLGDKPRAQAEARHAELGPAAAKSVLIAVDPVMRWLEIVTGSDARAVLDDRSCALAAASMASTFAVRDLDGGIAYGILAMVEHVRRTR